MAVKNYVLVCGGSACESAKGNDIYKSLLHQAEVQGVSNDLQIVKTGCFGFCEKGPIVKVLPDEAFYVEVKPEDAEDIISENIVKGRMVDRLLYKEEGKKEYKPENIKFYQKQKRIVLRNCGLIDPESIDEYIARDGYLGLEKALFELTPQQILDELKKSGLRGRGGAGFPTGLKWSFTQRIDADQKYVVCNADEGDPGAYMDRATLEGDPHSVIEAMIIAGKCVGADKGAIYIRAEYPLAIKRLEIAMDQARERGLLGDNILGTDFSFDLEIRLGAGAFVCGEETALLASIEGKRGMPIPKPPFPAAKGLFGKPTVINNVETYANIPVIISKGGDWFARYGTEGSKGTKVFALTGKIKNSGLIEVPMGTTLREIVFDIGGGIPNGKKFKAVQTGGPSGGVLTEDFLDTPIDFDSLISVGSMMGSGGMIVMDEDDCMVDVAKFYLDFCVEESCGKCAPCRIGTKKLYEILSKISQGKGEIEDLQKMKDMGQAMKKASLCGLGQTAPNPVLSVLNAFEEEVLEHINDGKCRAGKCKDLVQYSIDESKCIGCTVCARKCPVNCISGDRKVAHVIDQSRCVKCGACYDSCKFGAVLVS
ncbi:MAG: NADH-quinone oxidoreductase subunit NuoF [Spirochaetales bacterium]|nr:NADH-quinone oxidoreductase subunit NuoF [Spirochaetales bacterium]